MVDVDRGMLTVRVGKGDKDRCTVLPKSLCKEIAEQIERAREVWKIDREAQLPGVYMPGALARKFRKAAETFEWFWLFPARQKFLKLELVKFFVDYTPSGQRYTLSQPSCFCIHPMC